MPGCDQGSTSLAWITPPLPQLVSSAGRGLALHDLDAMTGLDRYQAVAVPTAPAPRTTVVPVPISAPAEDSED